MSNADYVYVTLIAAPRERVWEALTSAEFTRQYWHATRVQSSFRAGDPIEFLVDGENGDEVGCEGRILEAEHLSRLSFTWRFPRNPDVRDEAPSRVTFTLEAVGPHTRLTVVHDQFPEGSRMRDMVAGGWPEVLAGLKTLLETGRPVGSC
jgi:uncharacterized protein YndB with AHSA1/START domain